MRIRTLKDLVAACRRQPRLPKVAVVRCADGFVLRAGALAFERGVAEPVFVGDLAAARAKARTLGIDLGRFQTLDVDSDDAALSAALGLYRAGEVALLMKGLISTARLLKAVLDKENGVPPQGILSHVALFERPGSGRLMLLTDAAVNIRPNLQRKVEIVRNAVAVARTLGLGRPRVAMLAATEKVNYPAMPATLDADLLAKMSAQGEFGRADVAGPMALDVAVSSRAARIKEVDNAVAGRADILCAPDIESGNVLYKSLNSLLGLEMAAVVVGSRVPMVVPSRGDTERSKLYSLALAAFLARAGETSA